MAWIYNKKTTVLTECLNNDIVKVCKKDAVGYHVAKTLEDMKKVLNVSEDEGSQDKKDKTLEEMGVTELKAIAKEKGITGYSNLNKDELLAVIKKHDGQE